MKRIKLAITGFALVLFVAASAFSFAPTNKLFQTSLYWFTASPVVYNGDFYTSPAEITYQATLGNQLTATPNANLAEYGYNFSHVTISGGTVTVKSGVTTADAFLYVKP